METSLTANCLTDYVTGQLATFYPDGENPRPDVARGMDEALERLEFCFRHLRNKYFHRDGQSFFSHLHTDQYAMFLYFLSNTIHRAGGRPSAAQKIYSLNKALHGADILHEVELPDIFYVQHPVGTVLGRGRYSNYFCAYQRCTIGSNLEGAYPQIDEGVVVFGGSSLIGACKIGKNNWISAGSVLRDEVTPDGSIVFGQSPTVSSKKTDRRVIDHFFRPES